jgi:hypothetical protein
MAFGSLAVISSAARPMQGAVLFPFGSKRKFDLGRGSIVSFWF